MVTFLNVRADMLLASTPSHHFDSPRGDESNHLLPSRSRFMAPRAPDPTETLNPPSGVIPQSRGSGLSTSAVEAGSPRPPRKRLATPTSLSPDLSRIASAGLDTTRRSSSPKQNKRPRVNPQPMTAAAALADEAGARHGNRTKNKSPNDTSSALTSPNPAKQALGALMGIDSSGTRQSPSATSAPNTMSDAINTVAQAIQVSAGEANNEAQAQTSPASLSSFGTIGSSTALTALPNSSAIGSPGSMEEAVQNAAAEMGESTGDVSLEDGNKAFSYPGPVLPPHMTDSRRGQSLPHSTSRQPGSKSPSAKKHRCPYCATEFTRHHNLKSHLLTHSHEKPYVCQTCQSRFRRLHDLKRHMKLHTGERPHTCEKCGRRFARGDALARHNKGPGGCAGRRGSVGSFGGDDDFDGNDESMDGLVYTEPGQMEDEDESVTRPGMPSIRRHDAPDEPSLPQSSIHARQPSTYPPIQGRPLGGISGGLFPPAASHGGSSSSSTSPMSQPGTLPFPQAGTSISSHGPVPPGGSVFPSASMTESPKPLSPGANAQQHGHTDTSIYRNRSPSLTAQFQQQQFARGNGRRTPPPGLPPPSSGLSNQLPPPHSLNPPDSRYTLHSQGPAHPPTGPTGPPTHMSGGGLSSHSNSLSSHGQSQKGSGEGAASLYPQMQRDDRLWAYVKSLEDRVNSLQDEVTSLKTQLSIAGQPQPK